LDIVLLLLFFGSGYTILNTGVSLTHLRDSYTACETHRKRLHRIAEQQVRKPKDSGPTLKALQVVDGETQLVGVDNFDVRYDAEGRSVGSAYGGSVTPDYWSHAPPKSVTSSRGWLFPVPPMSGSIKSLYAPNILTATSRCLRDLRRA
jgi:hypothetical protein